MKIAFIIASMKAGGAERVVAHLANALASRKNKVLIYVFSDAQHYKINSDVTIKHVETVGKGSSYLLSASMQLRTQLEQEQPDVVISFLTEMNVISILASVWKKWKLIVSERNNPFVMPKKKAYRYLRKMLYPFANGYVFQTKQARDYFNMNIRKKSHIIHNPVVQTSQRTQYKNKEQFRVVSVGRLEPQKNMPLLIRSFAALHNIHNNCELTIYGEGSLRQELENLICDLGIKHVVSMPGNQKNIPECICKHDVFVLSSDYEGMSNALLEAMAVGLPCVSTDCPIGGSAELIDNGNNGILVPVGDEDRLTEALLDLYDSVERRNQMGKNASFVNYTHSIEKITDEWELYIKKVLGER